MKISKLAFIALLGGALMAFGCSDDASSTGGAGGDGGGAGGMGGEGGMGGDPMACDSTACIFCPGSALGPLGGVIGDLNVPIDFTAVAQGDVAQGATVTIDIVATSEIGPLAVPVQATVGATSTTTYEATTGGTGTLMIPIPPQDVSGTDLSLDGGSGSGDFMVEANATELVIRLTSALVDLQVTQPAPLTLNLDASATGGCTVLGEGVSIPVEGTGGAGGMGGTSGMGGTGGTSGT